MLLRCFAIAAPGLEGVLAAEVSALPGMSDVRAVAGGVELRTDVTGLLRANLSLRTASRLLVRVGEIEARDFAELRRAAAALPWEQLSARAPHVEATATTRRCRLHHTGAIAERLAAAVADRLGAPAAAATASAKLPEAGGPLGIHVRGEDDRFLVSVDSSGELLHRRGYRQETAKAPLRETLAAGLVLLSRWDPATPLLDPLCGAGTIPLEAALLALGRPPGAARGFSCERFPGVDAGVRAAALAAARAGERQALPAPIAGSDRDAGAVAAAIGNAERAGLAAHVRFTQAALAGVELPAGRPGLVLCNPPFGRRVRGPRDDVYAQLGALVRSRPGWRLGVLAPVDARPERSVGLPIASAHPLVHGGLRVRLVLFG